MTFSNLSFLIIQRSIANRALKKSRGRCGGKSHQFESEAKPHVILRLTRQQLTRLENEAKNTSPIEACALLFGELAQNEANVGRIVTTPNITKSATRFEIDSKAFYDAFMEADKDGLLFLGFFHSHPAPATPSSIDLTFMRLWGEAIWIIFSLTENKFAAFEMRKGKAYAVTLKIEGKD